MVEDVAQIRTVGIFRALQLGDLLCAVPSFRALRCALPKAHISLIGLPWAKSFTERFSDYFDEFILFPGAKGLPEQPFDAASTEEFAYYMKQRNFDLLIQMQGNGTIVNPLLQQWGAKHLAGFHNSQSRMPYPGFIEYPSADPEPRRHLFLMEHLGFPAQGDKLEFPILDKDLKDFEALKMPEGPFVVVHPGSRGAWRQWPPSYFARCADFCNRAGYAVIITGTIEERAITSDVIRHMETDVLDFTGKTSMGAAAIVIEKASLLISNCTGVAHIANALRTPSLILSMDGEPERWGPTNRNLHRVIDWTRQDNFEFVFSELQNLLERITTKPHSGAQKNEVIQAFKS